MIKYKSTEYGYTTFYFDNIMGKTNTVTAILWDIEAITSKDKEIYAIVWDHCVTWCMFTIDVIITKFWIMCLS